MKQVIAIILISIIMLTGCGNRNFDKAMEEGKLAIDSKEYAKAEDMFSLAIEEKKDNKEANALYKQIQKIIEAVKLKDDGKIEEAIGKCEDIEKIESESEAIKKEAKILKEEYNKEFKQNEKETQKIEHSLTNPEEVIDNTKNNDTKSKVSESINTTQKVIDTGKATIDGISVRSKNSSSGEYLGSLRTGDKIDILEKTANGWYRFKYNNKDAYVARDFIKLPGTKTVDNVLNTGVVYNTNKLTVRESCSTKSKYLGYLPKDRRVEIVRVTSTNWYKIKYEDSYAYVNGEYIKLTESKKKTKFNIVKRKNLDNFLFVGDSFTQRIANTIKSNNQIEEIFAQGGSRSSYWLDKVDEMPDKNNVKGVTLLIGVNGVTESTNIRDTKALINQLIVKYPDKKIYVQKVFPVGKNFTDGDPVNHNKLIKKYNQELEEFCATKSNIKMIDATKGFVDKKGYLINTSDGLHIDETMNNDFYNNIFNSIVKAEKDI